jgi:hypothetical protein
LLLATPLALGAPSATSATPELPAAEIVRRLVEANRRRDSILAGYQVMRRYHLKNELTEREVTMDVLVTFNAPSTLTFETKNQQGSSFLAREVFGRVMKSEQELAQPAEKRLSSMTPENYEFELFGQEFVEGRPAYRLEVKPRRSDKLLFVGRVWVDAQDFAVVRAEGNPSKRLNFWIRKADFVRSFKKVGPFWLPQRTDSVNDILVFGTTWVTIENQDYRVRLQAPKP